MVVDRKFDGSIININLFLRVGRGWREAVRELRSVACVLVIKSFGVIKVLANLDFEVIYLGVGGVGFVYRVV